MKKIKNFKQNAFTLTEVLIALAIVGVIAALVLPIIVTKYQENVLSHMYDREVKSIQQALDSLAITENKTSFYDTMMYYNTKPASYENNAGKFLKKYLRVSKYCGENNGNCFAQTYYEYKNKHKEIYTPSFKGACAALKNGASICITPKVGNNNITGIIDLNGPKGPNVAGRDLRVFAIDTTQTRTARAIETDEVYSTDYLVKIREEECNSCDCDPSKPGCSTPPPADYCATDNNSPECCVTPDRISQITSSTDACCNVGNNLNTVGACRTSGVCNVTALKSVVSKIKGSPFLLTEWISPEECIKNKSKWGIKNCFGDGIGTAGKRKWSDGWVYVVKTCGHVDKVIKFADLQIISQCLYVDYDSGEYIDAEVMKDVYGKFSPHPLLKGIITQPMDIVSEEDNSLGDGTSFLGTIKCHFANRDYYCSITAREMYFGYAYGICTK